MTFNPTEGSALYQLPGILHWHRCFDDMVQTCVIGFRFGLGSTFVVRICPSHNDSHNVSWSHLYLFIPQDTVPAHVSGRLIGNCRQTWFRFVFGEMVSRTCLRLALSPWDARVARLLDCTYYIRCMCDMLFLVLYLLSPTEKKCSPSSFGSCSCLVAWII